MSTEHIALLTETSDAAKAAAVSDTAAQYCGPGLCKVAVPAEMTNNIGPGTTPAILVLNDEDVPASQLLDEAVGHADHLGHPLTKAALEAQYANLPT